MSGDQCSTMEILKLKVMDVIVEAKTKVGVKVVVVIPIVW
jgi:hypothetical protein